MLARAPKAHRLHICSQGSRQGTHKPHCRKACTFQVSNSHALLVKGSQKPQLEDKGVFCPKQGLWGLQLRPDEPSPKVRSQSSEQQRLLLPLLVQHSTQMPDLLQLLWCTKTYVNMLSMLVQHGMPTPALVKGTLGRYWDRSLEAKGMHLHASPQLSELLQQLTFQGPRSSAATGRFLHAFTTTLSLRLLTTTPCASS